jgi:hypothetical protein
MTTPRWMITSLLALTAPLGLLACDGDEGDTNDASDEAADTTDDETTGDESDETLGRDDAEIGLDLDADGSMDFGEVDSDDRDDGSDDGELMGCSVNQTEDDCSNAMGCASVFGKAILSDGAEGWCSAAEAEYIGCVSTGSLCPPLTKTLCGGDQMWTTTGCVPDTLMVCEAPGDVSEVCA